VVLLAAKLGQAAADLGKVVLDASPVGLDRARAGGQDGFEFGDVFRQSHGTNKKAVRGVRPRTASTKGLRALGPS